MKKMLRGAMAQLTVTSQELRNNGMERKANGEEAPSHLKIDICILTK